MRVSIKARAKQTVTQTVMSDNQIRFGAVLRSLRALQKKGDAPNLISWVRAIAPIRRAWMHLGLFLGIKVTLLDSFPKTRVEVDDLLCLRYVLQEYINAGLDVDHSHAKLCIVVEELRDLDKDRPLVL